MMTIEVQCKRCKKPMRLEADEAAGQAIIDSLATLATCDACLEIVGFKKRKQATLINPDDVPKPYADA